MERDGQKKLLLVEDDLITAVSQIKQLEQKGYQVIHALNGNETYDYLFTQKNTINLILMDIDLGGGEDGTQVAEKILQKIDIPVVFLSSHTEPQIVEKTEKITSYGYVVKNTGITVLDASIKMAFKLFNEKQRVRDNQNELAAANEELEATNEELADINENLEESQQEILKHQKDLKIERDKAQQYLDIAGVIFVVLNPQGEVTLINQKGCEILGYNRSFILGKNWFDHFLPERDRETVKTVFKQIVEDQLKAVEYFENAILTMNGEEKIIAWHNSLLKDEAGTITAILSSGTDITEQKREEKVYATQLELIKYSDEHSMKKLLQRFLDEAEILTGSEIGFYHFVEDDQTTLSLQTWSTNTLSNMCTAEGSGEHYSISQAGVWVDCVRVRKPIIHNDYNNLTHKKGLPEGHAPIIRELVVPVFRNNKIKAILGVGNKKTNYDEYDMKTIQLLADLAWETVERKKNELALFESEEKLQFALIGANADSWEVDLRTNSCTFSKRWEQYMGYEEGEIPQTIDGVLSLIHPEDKANNNEQLEKHLLGQSQIYETTSRVCRKNGTYIWILSRGKIVEWENEKPVRLIGINFDITVQKISNDALKESEKKFRALYDNAPLSYQSLNEEGIFIDINPTWLTTLGYSRGEVLGEKFSSLLHPDERESFTVRFSEFKRKGSVHNVEFRLRHKNGDYLNVSFEGCIGYNPDGSFKQTYCVFQNITEKKKAEDEKNKQLVEKEILLKEVHHRIKNNLGSIENLLFLQSEMNTNPNVTSALSEIKNYVTSMRVLYEKMLVSDSYAEISIKDFLVSLIDIVRSLFPNRASIRFDTQIDNFLIHSKLLFPLGTIVNELLTNIMKHAFKNISSGIVNIQLKRIAKQVVLTIEDNGQGLPQGFDIGNSQKFGLFLIEMLTEQLKGTFTIENLSDGKSGTKSTLQFDI